MIFGNKNDFAIEAMVEPELKAPSSLWGRMCVWVQGVVIGDIDDPHCGLYPAYASFGEMLDNLSSLWVAEFSSMTDREIWNFLDGLLYSYHGDIEIEDNRSLEEMQEGWQIYGKFNFLTNWGEMFDRNGKSFLLKQPGENLKILNLDFPLKNSISLQCTEFSFRKAANEFRAWYCKQELILDSKNA